jgi:hypothetical protein
MDPNVVLNRVGRLARLDTTVFDEVKDDINETVPALVVAIVSAFLAGLGAFLWGQIVPEESLDSGFVNSFLLGSVFMAVVYGVAALVVYVVLVQLYGIQVDLQALIRVMGYASIPLAISVLMFVPFIWPVFSLGSLALLFVMMIYAVQSVSNADSKQVIISVAIGYAGSASSWGSSPCRRIFWTSRWAQDSSARSST